MKTCNKGSNGYKIGDRHRAGYYKEYYWKHKNSNSNNNNQTSYKDEQEDFYNDVMANDVGESEGW